MKPVVLIFGPSGVGKSCLLKGLAENRFLCVHIDTDRRDRTFAANGFPAEWDDDFHTVDFAHLVKVLRDSLDGSQPGAAMSFPTVHVFTAEKLTEAARLGATPFLLWGAREHCMKAAEERIKKKDLPLDLGRYARRNDPTFLVYCRSEYDCFRVEAFRRDGSRNPAKEWVAAIIQRIAA